MPLCAPAIQEYLLALPKGIGRGCVSERQLRPIARAESHSEQVAASEHLFHTSITATAARP